MSNGSNPSPEQTPKPPPAVAAAAARAEELLKQSLTPSDAPPSETPAEAPAQGEPAPEAQPQEPPQRNWQNDFAAMKGRYDRAEAENKLLAERLNGLETLLAQVQTTQPPPELSPEQQAKRLLTEKEEEEYGSEFLDVTKRAALEAVSPEVAKLQRDIEYLKKGMGAVGQNIAKSAKDRLYDQLDAEVPQWEQINEHPAYHAWLNEVDPYSGARRKSMLDHAFSRHDSQRVVTFFKGFLAEAAATDPQPPQGADYQTPAPQANGKPPLAAFAAPGRAGSAAQPSSAGKPVYTRSDISAFYRAKAAGHFRGREAEAEAIDNDIVRAATEGRVVS
jgi:hypothetical protein